MKLYLASLAVGILVGVIYGLVQVRSPAPPLIALLGLLGILLGEQIVPIGKHVLAGEPWRLACTSKLTVAHLFGSLPGHNATPPKAIETPKEQA